MIDVSAIPATNQQLENSPYKGGDAFFITARKSEAADGSLVLTVWPDDRILINPNTTAFDSAQLIERMELIHAVTLFSRKRLWTMFNDQAAGKDVSEEHQRYRADPDVYALGVGGFCNLRFAEGRGPQRDGLVLLKRGPGAPTNPDALTQPSGLASQHPLVAAWTEINEELPIVLRGAGTLSPHERVFVMPFERYGIGNEESQRILLDQRRQAHTVMERLGVTHLIQRVKTPTESFATGLTQPVTINYLDRPPVQVKAIVDEDPAKRGINLHFPFTLTLDRGFPGDLILVDPEELMSGDTEPRRAVFRTLEELASGREPLTKPVLENFVRRMAPG